MSQTVIKLWPTGARNHKICICEHNLHSEHLILHIWSLWVGTQLTQLLSGVADALWVRFLDLKMKNEPNCHNIMAHGGQKSQYPHLWTQSSLWTSDTSYMVTLGGYPTDTIAFRCSRCFMGQIFGSKDEKWAKLSYNYGPWGSEITKSAFVNTIFTLNIWYFIYGHSGWVPNWHKCFQVFQMLYGWDFLDLKMKNDPNCHIIMAHGGQKSQNPH